MSCELKRQAMQTTQAKQHKPAGQAIHVGELYGKVGASGSPATVYHVLAIHKQGITLQNMDNPLSQFDTTVEKLAASGYVKLSETPYVNLELPRKKKSSPLKLTRCPFTLDVFAERADFERPQRL